MGQYKYVVFNKDGEMRNSITVFVVFCILQTGSVFGADFIIQQGDNYDSFEVSESWFGTPTPIVDMTGGRVGNLYTYDSSTFNMYGGVTEDIVAQGNSTINLLDGTFGLTSMNSLYLLDYASLNVTDGYIYSLLIAEESSTVKVYNGSSNYLALYDNTIADIYGGNIGSQGGPIEIDPTATLTIHGYNFVFDPGKPGSWLSELTGDGLYGVPITIIGIPDPYTSENIHLVPEPGTLVLFTLGGLFSLKRRIK